MLKVCTQFLPKPVFLYLSLPLCFCVCLCLRAWEVRSMCLCFVVPSVCAVSLREEESVPEWLAVSLSAQFLLHLLPHAHPHWPGSLLMAFAQVIWVLLFWPIYSSIIRLTHAWLPCILNFTCTTQSSVPSSKAGFLLMELSVPGLLGHMGALWGKLWHHFIVHVGNISCYFCPAARWWMLIPCLCWLHPLCLCVCVKALALPCPVQSCVFPLNYPWPSLTSV